jgi:hypothetical protein
VFKLFYRVTTVAKLVIIFVFIPFSGYNLYKIKELVLHTRKISYNLQTICFLYVLISFGSLYNTFYNILVTFLTNIRTNTLKDDNKENVFVNKSTNHSIKILFLH